MKATKLLLPLMFGASTGLISACAINPATGTPDMVLMSESNEIKLGKEMHEKLLINTPIYQDEKLQQYIESVGQKVAKTSDRSDITYVFTIIDDPQINAFALPGGYIYVNRGLLAYLKTEAQLAAVLAHEIGHVTARHAVRQDAAHAGADILSIFTILTTGSAVLADMSSLWSTVAVKGYGREMELEADSFGATYLYNSGYDPQAMVETIGILKDHERFSRYRAKEEGKRQQSYHGLFSTHPRNDVRLKEVVKKAGELPADQQHVDYASAYRQQTEGLVYGTNYQIQPKAVEKTDENRYTHDKLGFTLVFPEKWAVVNQKANILGEPVDKSAAFTVEVRRLSRKISPPDYIRQEMKIPLLKQSENFTQYGLIGHMGLVETTPGLPDKRVAALFQGDRVYLLTGEVTSPEAKVDYDTLFLATIHSFQPIAVRGKAPKAKTIHYVKANENTTFARLATQMRIGRYGEEQLRLINGYYPAGEPMPGEWIKIIK